MKERCIPDEPSDNIQVMNNGIAHLRKENVITTFNHARWSGISAATLSQIGDMDNMEVVNGLEVIQDSYSDSSAFYETELRRERKAFPVGSDDSHTARAKGAPDHEYFQGFTVLKCPALFFDALINALESGAFYASSKPLMEQPWLDNGTLHVPCSPVCGVYIHGTEYRHRATLFAFERRRRRGTDEFNSSINYGLYRNHSLGI